MLIKTKRETATVAAYLVMLAAALAALGMTAANAWGAPARPDLVVGVAEPQPTAVLPGGTLVVGNEIANIGGARAGRSTTRLYLSADRLRGAGDVVLAERATRALGAGRSTSMRIAVALPAGTAPGSYYLVACADARGVVAERRERNNCRASLPITVVVPASPESPEDGTGDEREQDHGEHEHGDVPVLSAG
jgi:hypothetical protein